MEPIEIHAYALMMLGVLLMLGVFACPFVWGQIMLLAVQIICQGTGTWLLFAAARNR